jgi:hypothetical protein
MPRAVVAADLMAEGSGGDGRARRWRVAAARALFFRAAVFVFSAFLLLVLGPALFRPAALRARDGFALFAAVFRAVVFLAVRAVDFFRVVFFAKSPPTSVPFVILSPDFYFNRSTPTSVHAPPSRRK